MSLAVYSSHAKCQAMCYRNRLKPPVACKSWLSPVQASLRHGPTGQLGRQPPAASRGEASAPTPLSCSAKFPAYVIVAVDRRHARWSRSLYSGPLTLLQGHCFSGSRHSFREGKKRGSFFKVVTLHSVSSLIGCAFLDRPGFTIWRTRVEGPRVNLFTL